MCVLLHDYAVHSESPQSPLREQADRLSRRASRRPGRTEQQRVGGPHPRAGGHIPAGLHALPMHPPTPGESREALEAEASIAFPQADQGGKPQTHCLPEGNGNSASPPPGPRTPPDIILHPSRTFHAACLLDAGGGRVKSDARGYLGWWWEGEHSGKRQ